MTAPSREELRGAIVAGLRQAATAAFIMAVTVFLLTTNVRLAFDSLALYSFGFEQYDAPTTTGLSIDQLMDVATEVRDYFNSSDELLDVQVDLAGEVRPLFNEREILHMRDVKGLVRGIYALQALCRRVPARLWGGRAGGWPVEGRPGRVETPGAGDAWPPWGCSPLAGLASLAGLRPAILQVPRHQLYQRHVDFRPAVQLPDAAVHGGVLHAGRAAAGRGGDSRGAGDCGGVGPDCGNAVAIEAGVGLLHGASR